MEASDAQIPGISIHHLLGGAVLSCDKENSIYEIFRIISFLFPIVGLIVFSVKHKSNPALAFFVLKWAIIGAFTFLCGISLGISLIYVLNRWFG